MIATKLNSITFGITIGILSALAVFSFGILINTFLFGIPIELIIGTLHIHYNSSIENSAMLSLLGFMGGSIFGYIFAILYNIFLDSINKKPPKINK